MKRTPGKKYRVNGVSKSMLNWSKTLGVSYNTLWYRFKLACDSGLNDAAAMQQAVITTSNRGK